MCIPTPATEAAPANQVPSMQAADNLQLGGQGEPRGAAQLGRLQLRLIGNPTGAPAVAAPSASAPIATASSLAFPSAGPSAAVNSISNPGLRFGQGAGNR